MLLSIESIQPILTLLAVPLDGSTSVPLDGLNSTVPTAFNVTKSQPVQSSSSLYGSYSYWNYRQTPPSGYHVPTLCLATHGDVAPMQPTETREGLPEWTSCESNYISWYNSVTGFRRASTRGIPGTTHLGIENPQTASYSMPPECSSLCTISASRVQLLFWPTPYASSGVNATITSAPTPRISIGPDGYTFSSPSAYVIYSGLSAFGIGGDLGASYDNITQAYAPTALSTIYSCSWPFYQTSRVNFQDFNVPPRWSVISAHQGCDVCGQQYLYSNSYAGDALVTGYADMDFDQIPWLGQGHSSWTLQPSIAAPPGITDIDPAWKHCTSLYQGIWDPPRTMTPMAGMTPTATPAPKANSNISPTPAQSAAPASMPKDPLPTPTSEPVQADPGTTGQASEILPAQPWASNPKSEDTPQQAPASIPPRIKPSNPAASHAQPSGDPGDQPDDHAGSESGNHKGSQSDPSQGLKSDPSQHLGDSGDPPNGSPESGSGMTQKGSQPEPSHEAVSGAGSKSRIKPSEKAQSDPHNDSGQGRGTGQSQGTNADPATPVASSQEVQATGDVSGSPSDSRSAVNENSAGAEPSPSLPYVRLTAAHKPDLPSNRPDSAADNEMATPHHSHPAHVPSVTPSIGIVAAGHTFTPLNSGTVVADSMTLSIGGEAATMKGTKVSMGSSGLEVGTSIITIPSPGSDPLHKAKESIKSDASKIFTAAGETLTLIDQNHLLVNGATISRNSPGTTIGGKDFSFGRTGLVIGTSAISIPYEAAETIAPQRITAAGEIFTPIASDKLMVNGMTLTAGSPSVTISGQRVSFDASGLVIGSSTISLPSTITNPPMQYQFSAAGEIFTPFSNSLMLVDGITLTKGSPGKTIKGEVISLGSSALVVGSSTVLLSSVETSTSTPLGNIIMSGFGPYEPGTNAPSTGVQAFTGTASTGISFPRKILAIGTGCIMLYFWS